MPAFERQTEPLNAEDLGAVWHCLRSFPSLAFFNGGELSGARCGRPLLACASS